MAAGECAHAGTIPACLAIPRRTYGRALPVSLRFCAIGVLCQKLWAGAGPLPPLTYQMQGDITVTNYTPGGGVSATRAARFSFQRSGEQWSIRARDAATGYVAESAFDGNATYCLFRNLEVRTNINGKISPWRLPGHVENGTLHSDAVNAIVWNGEQPACYDIYLQAVWLGSVPNGLNVEGWKEPVVVPWSTALLGGISRFLAKPSWSKESEAFPAKLELVAARESSQSQVGSSVLGFDGLNAENPFPPGTLVGQLDVATWTNLSASAVALPMAWVIKRFWIGQGSGNSLVQECYWVKGTEVSLEVPPITAPQPGALTFATDTRLATGGIPVALSYVLSNTPWLQTNDPRLLAMLGRQAGPYIASIKARGTQSATPAPGRLSASGRRRARWVLAALTVVTLAPLLVGAAVFFRRRKHSNAY
jgi:hypothetical protein